MSTRAGTVQGKPIAFNWAGAWIAAILLALLFAVSLVATHDASGSVERAPAASGFTVGDQMAGGPSTVGRGAAPNARFAREPIIVNGSPCHQCR